MISDKTFTSDIERAKRRLTVRLKNELERVEHDAVLLYLDRKRPKLTLGEIASEMNEQFHRSYDKTNIKAAINKAKRRKTQRAAA